MRTSSKIVEAIQSQSRQRIPDVEKTLGMYIPECASQKRPGSEVTLVEEKKEEHSADKLIDDFLADKEQRVLLIQGESGTGKTMLTYHTFERLSKQKKEGQVVCHVNLPGLKNPVNDLVRELLVEKSHLTVAEMEAVLNAKLHWVLILDGYDEIKTSMNLLERNRLLDQLGSGVKVIISCRSQHLMGVANYPAQFAPLRGPGLPKMQAFCEIFLLPFNSQQIDQFLQKYVETYHDQAEYSDWKRYKQELQTVPEVLQLVSNPFMLFLVVDALPGVVRRREQIRHSKTAPDLLRNDLYQLITATWLTGNKLRMIDSKRLPDGESEGVEILWQKQIERLAQKLSSSDKTVVDAGQPEFQWFFECTDSKLALTRYVAPFTQESARVLCWSRSPESPHCC